MVKKFVASTLAYAHKSHPVVLSRPRIAVRREILVRNLLVPGTRPVFLQPR